MASDRATADAAVELLSPMGGVRARSMFGGFGIYVDEHPMFALIADDVLFFKVDDSTRAEFADAGGRPFIWAAPGKKPVEMSYWTPPPGADGDWKTVEPWARKGLETAIRNKKG